MRGVVLKELRGLVEGVEIDGRASGIIEGRSYGIGVRAIGGSDA
jgi:hypothetical protein